MAASLSSLLRCLFSHLFIFILCASLFSFCVSCSYIWRDAKAPSSHLIDAKAPNEKTATDAELYSYISWLDANINDDLFALSHLEDPAKRSPLKRRIHRFIGKWCKFMRIRTGRFYKKWIFDFPRKIKTA